MEKSDFLALTNPSAVAVVGASSPEHSWFGGRTFRNVAEGDPGRKVYGVNKRLAGTELLGRPVYADMESLPEVPDLTVVVTPAPTVPEVLESVGQVGCRRVILVSANRSEDKAVKQAYDREVRRIADRHSICLVGGNTIGIISPPHNLAATFSSASDFTIPPGGMAYIAQSGAALSYLIASFQGKPIGYSHLISTGDETVVSLPEMLEQIVDDEATDSIVLFLEGSPNGSGLRRALTKAQAIGKPVAALKVGRTGAGKKAAQSHTGRLTGDDDVYRALFAEAGVAVADSYEQLHDIAYRFGMIGRRSGTGRAAAIVTTSGGTSIVAADRLVEAGWTLTEPSKDTKKQLSEAGANPPANPLDVTGAFQVTDRLASLIRVMASSDQYDEIFLLSGAGGAVAAEVATHIADAAKSIDKPVSCSWIAPPSDEVIRTLEAAGLPVYPDPSRAVFAASAHKEATPDGPTKADATARLQFLSAPPEALPVYAASPSSCQLFKDLTEAGIACAPWSPVPVNTSEAGIREEAERIGYPLVLKIDSPRQSHKTEVGGVVTGIREHDALIEARDRLLAVLPRDGGGAQLVMQKMITGVEVLVGARRDPSFGPVLAVGLGGTEAELLADVRFCLLPATGRQLDRLVEGHERLATLLGGYRGSPRADVEALRRTISNIAAWIDGPGRGYDELDFNPVIVTPDGAFVVDARAIPAQAREADRG